MQLIQTYLLEHNGRAPPDIQRPLRSQKFDKCIDSQWDVDFIKPISIPLLLKLISACDDRTMDIRPLYDLACARVASCSWKNQSRTHSISRFKCILL